MEKCQHPSANLSYHYMLTDISPSGFCLTFNEESQHCATLTKQRSTFTSTQLLVVQLQFKDSTFAE